MFNTMTIVKIGGGVLGAFLFLLLGNWAASSFYSIAAAGHGEEGAHTQGYVIASAEEEAAPVEEEVVMSFAEVLAAADATKGAKVFGKCKACHKLDGTNATGPHLDGVVGRDVGTVADFGYSDAILGLGGAWDAEALNGYLENPKAYAPGNKMSFAGLKKETDRANLIAYLASIGG